jgi:hypothetical protein
MIEAVKISKNLLWKLNERDKRTAGAVKALNIVQAQHTARILLNCLR